MKDPRIVALFDSGEVPHDGSSFLALLWIDTYQDEDAIYHDVMPLEGPEWLFEAGLFAEGWSVDTFLSGLFLAEVQVRYRLDYYGDPCDLRFYVLKHYHYTLPTKKQLEAYDFDQFLGVTA